MSIEINLPRSTANRLEEKAAGRGLTLVQYLELVAEWESESPEGSAIPNDEAARLRAALNRGYEDELSGRVRPLADFVREQRARHSLGS